MSVVEAEKRTNRASIDSEVCELTSRRSSFVGEPDYANIARGCDLCHNLVFLFFNRLISITFFADGE